MANKRIMLSYIDYGQRMLQYARQLSDSLDEVKHAVLKGEYQRLESLNQKIISLSHQLAEVDLARFAMAKKLGCQDRQYANVIQTKLKGRLKEKIAAMDEKIEASVMVCKEKLARQGSVMILQHQVMEEALAKHKLRINV